MGDKCHSGIGQKEKGELEHHLFHVKVGDGGKVICLNSRKECHIRRECPGRGQGWDEPASIVGRKGILQSSVQKGLKMTLPMVGVAGGPIPKGTRMLEIVRESSNVPTTRMQWTSHAILVVVAMSGSENSESS